MLKNIGVEHRVTSAYNPRTNGLTERMNQSLITALRKHVETDHVSCLPGLIGYYLLTEQEFIRLPDLLRLN